jgi:carboxylate-amine ligase
VRIPDVCLTVDEAVTLAGLIAAMAATARRDAESGRRPNDARPELLEAAVWRSARYGLNERLIDVGSASLLPAAEAVLSMLAALRPALEEDNAWERIDDGVREIIAGGNGAARQRAVYRKSDSLADVARYIADQTAKA